MIFAIADERDSATRIDQASLSSLNIWERKHVQEWIRLNPEILGEELLIISTEFERFTNSSDRLDILALDRAGNLVVIELKRDSAAGYADLQALRYAAMVSSMTIDVLVPYYAAYRQNYFDQHLSLADATSDIIEFVESDSFDELSNRPRIILCSEGFSQEITATVLWLRDADIDISCVTITPYNVNGQILIIPRVLIPLAEARQYLVEVKRKEEKREDVTRKQRPKTMKILIENHILNEGDVIHLNEKLPEYIDYKEDSPLFRATITGKLGASDSVRWEQDGQEYSTSRLAAKIFGCCHPENEEPGSLNGSIHWTDSEGRTLDKLAKEFWVKNMQG